MGGSSTQRGAQWVKEAKCDSKCKSGLNEKVCERGSDRDEGGGS